MAFENELAKELHKYLVEQSTAVSEIILDGSCKDIEEYRARCGRLRALWDVSTKMEDIQKQRNSLGTETDYAEPS